MCSSELLFKITHLKPGKRQSSCKRLILLLFLFQFFVNLCGYFVEDIRNLPLTFPMPFTG